MNGPETRVLPRREERDRLKGRAHHCEPWQVRDDGCGLYCAACGARHVEVGS